jgi:hypothetical protein
VRICIKCVLTEQATGIVVVTGIVVIGIEWRVVPSPSPYVIVYITIDGIANLTAISAVAALAAKLCIVIWAITIAAIESGA